MSDFHQQVQLQMPSPTKLLTPAVTAILILIVIGFALINYARDFTFSILALSKSGIFSGKIWQLITYSLINGGCGLVFNGLVILFFGSLIERQWKTYRPGVGISCRQLAGSFPDLSGWLKIRCKTLPVPSGSVGQGQKSP